MITIDWLNSHPEELAQSQDECRSVPITTDAPLGGAGALVVGVEGPDDRPFAAADARRLFPGGSPITHDLRLGRLHACPRVVATVAGRVAGVATCRQIDREMHVFDFAVRCPSRRVAASGGVTLRTLIHAMLDVIELASMAGACDCILVYPARVPCRTFERQGYSVVDRGDAGRCWKKRLSVAESS